MTWAHLIGMMGGFFIGYLITHDLPILIGGEMAIIGCFIVSHDWNK